MSAMSLRQLARLIGVSDTAVRKAERGGVFGDAVRRDAAGEPGVVDVHAAITAWERSGRQLRGTREARQDDSPAPPPAPLPSPAVVVDDALLLDVDAVEIDAPPVATSSPSLVEAQRLAMQERYRRLKLENDTREGALIPAGKATSAAFEFARVLRENVMNVPGRVAAEIAAESDATRVHLLLEAALREALETTANTMDAAPPPAPETTAA